MPRLTVSLELLPALDRERELCCVVCGVDSVDWKLLWGGASRGLHTKCKILLERRSSEPRMEAVKP